MGVGGRHRWLLQIQRRGEKQVRDVFGKVRRVRFLVGAIGFLAGWCGAGDGRDDLRQVVQARGYLRGAADPYDGGRMMVAAAGGGSPAGCGFRR